jgi:DNA-binding GntR family transcriptional regulator
VTAVVSKAQLAHDWIRRRIESGSFTPGYRLVIDALARELNMSPVPVREAIRLLEAEGLVTFTRNVGAQVAFMHEEEYLYTMQTLALVEGMATALALPSVSQDDIAQAREINARMKESLAGFDPSRFSELNREFHAVFYEHCSNPHIRDLVDRGWKRLTLLRNSVFGFVPGRAFQSVEEHEALLGLMERGASPLDVELAARNHRLATLDAVLTYSRGEE